MTQYVNVIATTAGSDYAPPEASNDTFDDDTWSDTMSTMSGPGTTTIPIPIPTPAPTTASGTSQSSGTPPVPNIASPHLPQVPQPSKTLGSKQQEEGIDKTTRSFLNLYKGQKPHRKLSLLMDHKGYYIQQTIAREKLLSVIWKEGGNNVIFAAYCYKINRHNKKQDRSLVLSNRGLYFFPTKSTSVHRSVPLESISYLSMSTRGDHYLIIHVANKHAAVLILPRKTEFLMALFTYYRIETKRELRLVFNDHIVYNTKSGHRSMRFIGDGLAAVDEFDFSTNPDNKDEILVKYQFSERELAAEKDLQRMGEDDKFVRKITGEKLK
eukprot:TRINITY_DN9727_c0_g1_i1.p1 TRINITY_DN9727_c0_g1~~TRINITY_DN9727_c0_g1_i1.p1  ORF type:complete len:347 (-),score=77.57 TRINITY_DN9727_c0_g1_i1:91-1065(-)